MTEYRKSGTFEKPMATAQGLAMLLALFGDYLGTERRPGLRWTLPWNIRKKVSARIRNYNVETLKVNDERRAAMVSNLMVVLCSERDAQPIVNAGTLYQ